MVFLSKDHGEPFQPLTNRNPPQMQTLFKPNCGVSLPSAYSRASHSQSRQSLILLALADVAASPSRADWTVRRVISNCADQRCVQRHWQLCRAEVLSTCVQSYLQLFCAKLLTSMQIRSVCGAIGNGTPCLATASSYQCVTMTRPLTRCSPVQSGRYTRLP